jgi:hypothetical protein
LDIVIRLQEYFSQSRLSDRVIFEVEFVKSALRSIYNALDRGRRKWNQRTRGKRIKAGKRRNALEYIPLETVTVRMHIQRINAQIVTRQLETLEDLAECQFVAVSEDYYILHKAKEKSFSRQ